MWWVYALISSLAFATFAELNYRYKLGPFRLGFWQLFMSAVFLTPWMVSLPWPEAPAFYFAAIANGFAMSIGTVMLFKLSAKYNGRVATLYMPVKIFGAFFLWLALDQVAWIDLTGKPFQAVIVVFSLCLMVWALFSVKAEKSAWQAVLVAAPIGIMYASLDVVAKYVLEGQDVATAATVFAYIAFVSGAVIMAFYLYLRPQKKKICPPNMLKASVFLSVLGIVSFIALLASLRVTPNPAYTSAIILLSSVWLMMYHRAFNIEDNQNPRAGLAMVVAALGLAFIAG